MNATLLVDQTLRITGCSAGAARQFGRTPAGLIGVSVSEVLPGWTWPRSGGAERVVEGLQPGGSVVRLVVQETLLETGEARSCLLTLRPGACCSGAGCTCADLPAANLGLALRAANAGVWRWNRVSGEHQWCPNMCALHANPAGPGPATLTHDELLAALHPDDRTHVAGQFAAALRTGRSDFIYRVKLPDGRARWLHSVGEAEAAGDGGTGICWNGITLEITDHEEAADRLRINEERYRAIVEAQDDAVCLWKPDTTLTFANTRYRELYGIPAGDLGGRRWIEYVPEPDRPAVIEVYRSLAREPRNLSYEHAVKLADGSTRWVLWVDVPLFDREGNCVEFQSVGRDITERKRAEEALRDSEERYRNIVDTAQEGIWMLDAEARTTFVNQRLADMLGYTGREMAGRSFLEFMDESERAAAVACFERRRAGLDEKHDFLLRRRDGRPLWTLVSASPLFDRAGGFLGSIALLTDITDRKAMESDLLQREALFRTVFESAPLGIALINPDGTTQRVNRALAELLGYSQEEIQSRMVADLTHPDDMVEDLAHFERLMRGEIPRYALEKRLIHRDGSAVWVRIICCRTSGTGASPIVVGLVEDISQRRRTDAALRTLFERTANVTGTAFFAQMVSQLAAALEVDAAYASEIHPGGERRCLAIHAAPDAACNYAGIIPDSPCADAFATAERHLQDRPAAGAGFFHQELPVTDGLGQVMGSIGILNDTPPRDPGFARWILQIFVLRTAAELERRRRDEEVSALTRDLEQRVVERTAQLQIRGIAMDNTIEGMSVLRDERYLYMNEPHAGMYGFHPTELLGKTWRELYAPDEQGRIEREIFPLLVRDGRWRGEVTGRRKTGESFAAEVSLALADDGHLICSCRDISVARAARDMLSQRSQMLERATRAKDEFLAAMSHELRTPLAGVLMTSESMRQNTYGPLNERQQAMLVHIEESGKHLLELINDILDLSKIEAGKVELHIERIGVRDVCDAATRMVRQAAAKKGLHVSVLVEPAELMIDVDVRRLRQMLVNLLGNAVKFTPEGGSIGIRATRVADGSEILLTVWDTGIGIERADIQKIFKPFTQIDSSLARRYGGTGLGLPLVQRMAELHGGGVSLESEPGRGSAFTIHLPGLATTDFGARAEAAPRDAAGTPVPGSCGRILVADDNETTLAVIADHLESRGFQCDRARNGTEAIMAVLVNPPDLVLLDIQMPGMDGFEVTRAIRTQNNPRLTSLPIVALTALAMPGDRERCLVAGMTDYLTKPVRFDELLATVRRYCHRQQAADIAPAN